MNSEMPFAKFALFSDRNMLQNILFNKLPKDTQLNVDNINPGDLLMVGSDNKFSSVPKGDNNTFLTVGEDGSYVFLAIAGLPGGSGNGGNNNQTTQISPPNNPNKNDIWNQIDMEGELVDRWIFTRGRWMSTDVRRLSLASEPTYSGSTRTFRMSIDNSYDYWIRSLEYTCNYRNIEQVNSSNYVRVEWVLQPANAIFAQANIFAGDQDKNVKVPIDTIISPRNETRIEVWTQRVSQAPQYVVATSLYYRLVYPQ